MFSKVLVANRGEIAVRVIRALKELGIASVAVYSEVDREAPHVREGGRVLPARARAGAGELPERREDPRGRRRSPAPRRSTPATASWPRTRPSRRPARRRGSCSSGPPAAGDRGDGLEDEGARELMKAAGVPIVPGTTEPVASLEEAQADRRRRSAIRSPSRPPAAAAARASGSRMGQDELEKAIEGASREGEKFFSDPTVYLERYLEDPRHVEVQVLADAHGQRRPPRRARLLGPAPPPEADRGDAGAGRRRGVPRADRQDRHRRRAGDRLPLRGHDRGPAGAATRTASPSTSSSR